MGDRVIPPAVITPREPGGQHPPEKANKAAKASTKQQLLTASRDTALPIIYGGPERVAGSLYIARIYQSKLLLCQLLGEGPVQQISGDEMNDAAVPAGVTITKYLGTQTQTVDPTLAAAIHGFTERMLGTAYVVITVPKSVSPGFPRFTFEVKGKKVYDPRDGAQLLADPSTWTWSDNPALCLADFLSNESYGARKPVDWDAVSDAADYCDETVTGAAGSEKRALLTLALAEKRTVKEWIDVLRSYVPAWIDYDGPTAIVIPDMPRASDHTFTAANIDTNPAPMLMKRGVRDTPNVVQVGFMRTDVKPWAMDYAEAVAGSPAVRRKTRIDMPGIRRYSQARRFAIERLNHGTLEDLEGQIAVFEEGLEVLLGDRATVTDDIGLAAKEVRITARIDQGHGRWLIGFREYDPAAYSNVVETSPSTPDTGLPDPKTVEPATSLTITETIYLEKNLGADSLARGLIYQSRFDVAWVASTHAYPVSYRVQFLDGVTLIHEGSTQGTTYASPTVQQGKTYTVRITAVNSLGFESSVLSSSQVAQGKLLPPGPVPNITSALEIGGELLLQWEPAVDIDVVRYEWRYAATGGFSWATATLIDRTDGLRARFRGLPVGTWRFAVKAIDSVGNYSTTETTVDRTITTDADAFLQEHEFLSPTLTNMMEIPALEGVWKKRWATRVAADVFTSVEPNPFNSGGSAAVINYHASASSKFQGDNWDLGILVTGDWQMTPDVTVVSGSVVYEIEHSDDGAAWTAETGTSWKGSARYVRPIIRSATTSTLIINKPPKMSLAAVTHRESGSSTSSAGAATTITLAGHYALAVSINIQPKGTAARIGTVDNVVLSQVSPNTFDVYLFDAAGVQVASAFDWTFEGF